MPNLFKNLLKTATGASQIDSFVFEDVSELSVEAPLEETPEEEQKEPQTVEEMAEALQNIDPEEDSRSAAQKEIDFARIQARRIMEQAEKDAAQLLEDARQKAEEELAALRADAVAQGRDEGYREGYGEGLQKAKMEGEAQRLSQMEAEVEEVRRFLQQATAAREDMLRSTQQELIDLCLAVAEKVIHVSLKSSTGVIARMIQVATEKLRRREWVHIYVGGYTGKELSSITPELKLSLSGLSEHIKIVPMPEDEVGTLIIEMPDEIIDASASTQVENMRGLLKEQ